jgi:hypothetical protein
VQVLLLVLVVLVMVQVKVVVVEVVGSPSFCEASSATDVGNYLRQVVPRAGVVIKNSTSVGKHAQIVKSKFHV